MISQTAVADANAIIGLAKGGVFHLLARQYTVLYVPRAVVEEVVVKGRGRPGASELAQALGSWARQMVPAAAPGGPLAMSLSATDRDVLAIAREHGVDHILSSDNDLHREAVRLGLTCLSTLEVIVLMKRQDLISSVRVVLDAMLAARHGIHLDLYEQVLRTAGEWLAP